MSDLCDYWAYVDPNNKVPKDSGDYKTKRMQMTKFGLTEYFECYNPDYQSLVKKQMFDVNVLQVTLFKAAKIQIANYNKGLEAKKLPTIPEPADLEELMVDMKPTIEKNKMGLFATGRFVEVCAELQTFKKEIMWIPDCKVLEPFARRARENFCYNG